MAANRYGQIWHGNHHHINIRFPSNEARLKFQNEFQEYHASHEHEGEVPTFKHVTLKDLRLGTGDRSPEDLVKAETDAAYRITLDGYGWSDIHDYHNPRGWSDYFHYHVPTCCVSPTIVIDREFVDSGTLQRHELSALIGDMPDTDFQSLMDSITADGVIDNIINIHEGQILDGWHRFRACQELNLLRKLRFKDYDTEKDGDPVAFVLARNVERRQLSAGQRAQVSVAFNERFGHGGDRSKSHNGGLKTRQQLAAQAGVGTTTIDRAIAIEKAGESEAVIAGEKTAGEVLKTREAAKSLKRKKQLLKDMWDKRKQASRDYIGDSDTDLNQHLMQDQLEDGFAQTHENLSDAFKSGMKRCTATGDFAIFEKDALKSDISIEVLEKECKAISIYAHHIASWTEQDWIQERIERQKNLLAKPTEADDLKTLWKQVNAEIPAWKQRDKEDCQYASDHIGKASKSMLVQALRNCNKDNSTGPATAEELKQLLTLLQKDYFPFILRVRDILKNKDKTEKDTAALIEQIEANVTAFRNLYAEHYEKGITPLADMFTAGITEYNLPKEGLVLSLDNPTGGYTDAKTLQRIQGVTARFIKDWTESRVKAGWIRKCLQTEEDAKAELWEKIDARLPKWKERLPVENQDVPVENFTKDLLIAKFREYHERAGVADIDIGEPGTPLSLVELEELLRYIRNETHGIIFNVRKALLADVPEKPTEKEQIDRASGVSIEFPVSAAGRLFNKYNRSAVVSTECPVSDWEQAHQHCQAVLVAFGNILKSLHVRGPDVAEFIDDVLRFFHGTDVSELPDASPEELKAIANFFQPLLLIEVTAWPEYIRNHHALPERELCLKSRSELVGMAITKW